MIKTLLAAALSWMLLSTAALKGMMNAMAVFKDEIVQHNRVTNAQSGNGISVSDSPGACVVESVVVASYRDGVRIRS